LAASAAAATALAALHPFGASTYNLTANATGGEEFRGGGDATAAATASNGGNATANATGGGSFNKGGDATAAATVSNGGNATANATGGFAEDGGAAGKGVASATSTALLGGTANATATATGGIVGAVDVVGGANATSSATTINGNAAQAKSTATGQGLQLATGQAQATAQTNFGNFQSVQTTSTSPLNGQLPPQIGPQATTVTAIAQAGGVVALSNAFIPGQSFSVVSGSGFGSLTVANGAMGAGAAGLPLTYQESATFTQLGGAFVLDLLSSDALGTGFDSALFQILLNGIVFDSESFTDLASAEAFFSNHLIGLPLLDGLDSVQLQFSEMMSTLGEGFSFDYAVASIATAPVPGPVAGAGLPGLILAGVGLLASWRRRRQIA
jgi:hypothetical protein